MFNHMNTFNNKNFFHIITAAFFLIVFASNLSARPFLTITTATAQLAVETNSIASVSYQVLNSSGIQTKNMVYDVSYQNFGITVNPQGTTCGSSLKPFETCTLNLFVSTKQRTKNFRLIPRVCTDNGVVCSVPNSSNRTLIEIVPTPLILAVNTTPTDQHLQIRSLTLSNAGSVPLSLNQITITPSGNIQNQTEVCTVGSQCILPPASQPSCFTLTSLTPGQSCLIWVRSIDLENQPLGSLSGTITVAVHTSPESELNQEVFALNYNNDLYAGGRFTSTNGVAALRIARWTGSTWLPLSSGIPNNEVEALSLYQYDLFIGGNFQNAGSASGDRIVRWDGILFNSLATGLPNGRVRTLTTFNNQLIVGGNFTNAAGPNGDRVVSWDGFGFSPLSTGIGNQNVFASEVYQNELILGGNFTNVGGPTGDRIINWNGLLFNPLANGISNRNVRALCAQNATLYVGGNFINQYGALGDRVLQWDGTTFTPLSLVTSPNNIVRALTMFNSNLILGGSFTNLGGATGDRVVAWDGANYIPLASGFNNGSVFALAVAQTSLLFAGGSFTNPATRIAQWDGATWTNLGTGANNRVQALLVASSLAIT